MRLDTSQAGLLGCGRVERTAICAAAIQKPKPRPLPMFSVRSLEGLPDNFDEFVDEIAAGLRDLYGPRAAEAYRQTASTTVGAAVLHPSVEAVAVDDGPRVAGFLLALTRLNMAQISFIHVLRRHAGYGIEQLLLEETVRRLRKIPVEGIVAEFVPLCRLDLDETYATLGFDRVERLLMTARLGSPRLAPPGPEGIVCDERNAADVAGVVVEAYRDHPGRMLHIEVRTHESALEFVRSALQGGYGPAHPGFVRGVVRDGRLAAAIVGCEVAPDVGFVLQVAVRPACQRQGLGSQLLRQLAQRFRQAGLTRMALGVTKTNPALGLYERLGFRPLRPVTAHVWWDRE
jgi:ribosomal protein S18 acetylase RimI-like enzyme